ncbi:MAG: hypothetical protein CVU96_03745 [Firmicutes bacterium HGW-Firmicutes-20]|nr:MAG: hypothetical protein CVU96_03745 [Firmicutes bacterium HGW-Firmicutes-20]PKM70247.1 MAG: hypothetical protein CVU94_00095 [Firmicutes bacterium HGW-Firmicutes-19]
MSESIEHMQLVKEMKDWVVLNIFHGDESYILADCPGYEQYNKPKCTFGGYFPDLYAYRPLDGLLVIGEAKSAKDIERSHSISQYESYLTTCKIHDGKSMIVLSVPYFCKPIVNNIFKRKLKYSTDSKIELRILEF